LSSEVDHLRSLLRKAGYKRTPTGEWKPPLGKRPDFYEPSFIKAVFAAAEATQDALDAMRKYEEAHK
jgi:hypothetical protein